MLDIAGNLTNFVTDKQNFGRGVVELPDSASKNFANLATTINFVKKPELDMSELSFSTQIEINISDLVKASQILQIDGKLLDHSVAIVIRTLNPATYSESIQMGLITKQPGRLPRSSKLEKSPQTAQLAAPYYQLMVKCGASHMRMRLWV